MALTTKEPEENLLMSEDAPVTELMNSDAEYNSNLGAAYQGDSRELLKELPDNCIDLVVTSPPFALQHQKAYGNEDLESYNDWFMEFVPEVRRVLQPHGSFVIEIGGAFKQGKPERSTYQYELLPRITKEGGFHLAQDMFWHNPAKLPNPVEWVNVSKVRVTDAVTQIWWLAKDINKEVAYTDVIKGKRDISNGVLEELDDSVSNGLTISLVTLVQNGSLYWAPSETENQEEKDGNEDLDPSVRGRIRDEITQWLEEEVQAYAPDHADDLDRLTLSKWHPKSDAERVLEALEVIDDHLGQEKSVLHQHIFETSNTPRRYLKKVIKALERGENVPKPRPRPEVNNQSVLQDYSESQKKLLAKGDFNDGERPSGWDIDPEAFANDNKGSLPDTLLEASNTASNTHYLQMCREFGYDSHPARFPRDIPEFFVDFLTPEPPYDDWDRGALDRPIVLDIFGGSNITGKVAESRGRHWLTFEAEEEYVQTSQFRFLTEEQIELMLNDEQRNFDDFSKVGTTSD